MSRHSPRLPWRLPSWHFQTAFFWRRPLPRRTATRCVPNRELVALGLGEHTGRAVAGLSRFGQSVADLDRRFRRRQDAAGATDSGRRPAPVPVLPHRSDRAAAEGRPGCDPHRHRHRHAGNGVAEGRCTRSIVSSAALPWASPAAILLAGVVPGSFSVCCCR
jgi:hypothetical protein